MKKHNDITRVLGKKNAGLSDKVSLLFEGISEKQEIKDDTQYKKEIIQSVSSSFKCITNDENVMNFQL